MPTYQYACTVCAEPHEVVQKFTDDPLTECPACGGTLRKVFSAVGVVFKGSGFYKTDSRASAKPAAAASSNGSSDSSSGSSGSSGSSSGSSGSESGSAGAAAKPAAPAAPAASSTGSGTAAAG